MATHSFADTPPSAAYTRLAEQASSTADEPLLELLGMGGIDRAGALY